MRSSSVTSSCIRSSARLSNPRSVISLLANIVSLTSLRALRTCSVATGASTACRDCTCTHQGRDKTTEAVRRTPAQAARSFSENLLECARASRHRGHPAGARRRLGSEDAGLRHRPARGLRRDRGRGRRGRRRRPCCTSGSPARGATAASRCWRPSSAPRRSTATATASRSRPTRRLLAAARRALPEALALPIGTSARVGGTSGMAVEAMEGHAVLSACLDEGVPALELRVISNEIERARPRALALRRRVRRAGARDGARDPRARALLVEIGRT